MKISKTVLIIIGIVSIVFVMIVCCVSIFFFSAMKNTPDVADENGNLSNLETEEFLFYYPSYFIKESESNVFYINPEPNDVEGYNHIVLHKNGGPDYDVDDDESCDKAAEELTEFLGDPTLYDSSLVTTSFRKTDSINDCRFTINLDNKVYDEYRIVSKVDSPSEEFVVKAQYSTSEDKQYGLDLRSAMNGFEIL